MGGLPKKATLVDQILNDTQSPSLRLDAGNVLFKKNAGKLSERDITKAENIYLAHRMMGFNAISPGPADLFNGIDFLKKIDKENAIFVSANIINSSSGQNVFKPFQIHRFSNLKIAIIGVTPQIPNKNKEYTIADPAKSLEPFLQQLSKTTDFIILLSSLTKKENNELAKKYPSIGVILSADIHSHTIPPTIVNKTIVTKTLNRSVALGYLEISDIFKQRWRPDWPKLISQTQNKSQAYAWQIKRLAAEKALSSEEKEKRIAILKEQKAKTDARLTQLKREKEKNKGKYAFFSFQTYKVTANIQPNVEIEKLFSRHTMKKKK